MSVMLSKEAQAAIDQLWTGKRATLEMNQPLTPEAAHMARTMGDDMMAGIPIPTCIMVENVEVEETRGEFYTFDNTDADKIKDHVLLFIHGGGFATGTVASRRPMCTSILAHAKMDGYSVEYSQWPEAQHPKGLEDSLAAYRWLLSKGYEPNKIHLFGESAGATMVLVLALYLRDHGEALPESVTVFSPPVSQDTSDPSFPSHTERFDRDPMITGIDDMPYFNKEDARDPYASPIYADWEGFPRLSIHVGTEELLYDDAIVLKEKAEKAGVDVTLTEWEGLFHVFPLFPCPETDQAVAEIGEFIRKGN